jgi:hypothetical protein
VTLIEYRSGLIGCSPLLHPQETWRTVIKTGGAAAISHRSRGSDLLGGHEDRAPVAPNDRALSPKYLIENEVNFAVVNQECPPRSHPQTPRRNS